jgi:hypothetical protein
MDATIQELHRTYCQATGMPLPLRFDRERVWFDFEKAGFTKEDLLLAIRWVRAQMKIRGSGYSANSLRFSTLLQLDYFEEKLLLARQAFNGRPRKPAMVEQTQAVGDVSRLVEVPAPDETVNAGEAVGQLLRNWRLGQKRGSLPTSEVGAAEPGGS